MNFPVSAEAEDFLTSLEFVPWEDETASGFYRRVIIVKDGLLGEVARYMADDYIIFNYRDSDIQRLKQSVKPEADLMTQRWLFVQQQGENSHSEKHFWFGFRGGAHFYRYSAASDAHKDIADLAYIVNKAAEIGDHGTQQHCAPII